MMYEVDPRGRDSIVSLPLVEHWRRELKTLSGISIYTVQTANLTAVAEPDRLRAAFVSAGFSDMLGVQPLIGRGFREGEDHPGAAKTALLSYAAWQTRFGSDPAVIGRSLVLNNEPHEVIGVLSSTFEFPIDATDVWMIETASLARAASQSGNGGFVGYDKADEPQPAQESMLRAQFNAVTPGFFRAMSIALFQGRVCDDTDTADSPVTIVINRHLAERLWPGQSPLGRQLRSPDIPVPATIVGIVGNTRPQLPVQPITAQIYGCLSQQPGIFATVIAKTTRDPMSVARAVQQAVWSVDRDQPVWKIRSGDTLVAGTVQTQRFVMVLMSAAAALALLLAALGTYSILSYSTERRAREVGVRLALGATRLTVVRLMLSQTALLIATGVALGLGGALVLSDVLAAQLFEVSPRDPLTFGATAALLAAIALVAAWVPARRASSVDPMITLRAG